MKKEVSALKSISTVSVPLAQITLGVTNIKRNVINKKSVAKQVNEREDYNVDISTHDAKHKPVVIETYTKPANDDNSVTLTRDQGQAKDPEVHKLTYQQQVELYKKQAELYREQAEKNREQAEKEWEQAEKHQEQASKYFKQVELDRVQVQKEREQALKDMKQAALDREQALKDRQLAEKERIHLTSKKIYVITMQNIFFCNYLKMRTCNF